MSGEIAPAPIHMTADHRHEGVLRRHRLEKMNRGKLRMVGHRIRPANFQLDPYAAASLHLLQHYIGLRRVANPALHLLCNHIYFRTADPLGWAIPDKGILKVTGETGHESDLFLKCSK